MKISAFTFIKNGQILGYPFIQSIQSILPIVDEFVINVGQSEDDTLTLIQSINNPKIRIIQSTWNDNMHDRGYVYGQQKMIASLIAQEIGHFILKVMKSIMKMIWIKSEHPCRRM